jgi:hypothetical protein
LTVTGKVETADRVAVKVALAVPVLPSVTTTSSIEILGLLAVSSLVMVAVAVLVVIVELSGAAVKFGLLRVTIIVSSGSTTVSPKTSTVIVLVVSFAAKAIVPVALVAPAALILL